jgi:hypothetical protein
MKVLIASFLVLGLIVGGLASAHAGGTMKSPYSQSSASKPTCPPGWEAAYQEEEIYREPSGELILFDAMILRPLGVVATAVGTVGAAVFVAPWTANTCDWDLVEKKLIREPANYTFCRPLGDVDY